MIDRVDQPSVTSFRQLPLLGLRLNTKSAMEWSAKPPRLAFVALQLASLDRKDSAGLAPSKGSNRHQLY